jgi:hypothetical protein
MDKTGLRESSRVLDILPKGDLGGMGIAFS